MKIYTRRGDGGETGLLGGPRVSKDHLRVASSGDLDELSAVLGLVKAHARDADLSTLLREIQRDLFAVGAQLADPSARVARRKAKAAVPAARIRSLERAIDARERQMPQLKAFILPGGSRLGSFLHLARTVCRRAERSVVTLARAETVDRRILAYVNRLSDLLFVLARYENHRSGEAEDRW
ncbi:MAG TPA: cob(I)yrinic acid a,c-diamide adenosyltransferase [Vicinamibacteria bacterium]|nr:cob(I)yrinic acid a,c-diamide adenosyltransferase [Vicinamibacteria bacterium]